MEQGSNNTKPNHVDFKSAFYFQTPVWVGEAPMFLKDAIKLTDKYIKKGDQLLKDKLKDAPKWKKDLGDFGLSRHVLREMAHQGLLPGVQKSSW